MMLGTHYHTFSLTKTPFATAWVYHKSFIVVDLQNTPQSMKYATRLWSEMVEVGTVPVRRAATFMAGMLLINIGLIWFFNKHYP